MLEVSREESDNPLATSNPHMSLNSDSMFLKSNQKDDSAQDLKIAAEQFRQLYIQGILEEESTKGDTGKYLD